MPLTGSIYRYCDYPTLCHSVLDEFIALMEHSDIYQKIPHGSGQSILREALQIADHNAYHISEIIALRRFLGDWK